uniref:AlkB homolog 4, lysine demthylase n=1 Tax=Neogobius melanostomus TaxID=47308 RepID=A0A8C6S6Q8_9GOBI
MLDPEEGLAVSTDGDSAPFALPGVFLQRDFISEQEELELVELMDRDVWTPSQSGRRKQDFGPKVNFKKRRVRVGGFSGLPAASRRLVERMHRELGLKDFQPVEQCNLDYSPDRGAHIDPHLDDSWLWGERLVTVNLLSDTTLTLTLLGQGLQVAVPLPRRSLLVLSGPARHTWKHGIQRAHIGQRRVCSTFRELSAQFLPGGESEEQGAELLRTALTFTGAPL